MPSQDYIQSTSLSGVFTVSRPMFEDARGFVREVFRKGELEAHLGFAFEPMQANHSRSSKGTLRGIHVAPWHKLVSVTNGEVQQVIVDTRIDSPTFGKYISIILGESNMGAVFIPAGCGNAFLVISRNADYTYLVTDIWEPGKEKYISYNDPDIAVAWQTTSPIVSEKDMQNPTLREVYPQQFK